MACNTSVQNVRIEPCNISWGRAEKLCITPLATASVPAGSYITMDDGVNEMYIWMNTTGTDPDPAPAGRTGIEVDISGVTTAAEVANAIYTAVEADGTFYSKVSTDGLSVDVEAKIVGKPIAAPADGSTATTFTLENEVSGIGGDLGYTSDAIELSMTVESIDLLANQTGTTPIDKFINGHTASISCTLSEMTKEKWDLIVGEGLGGKYTPSAGTEVVGYGLDGIGKSYFALGGKLILHPVNLPASDKSRDITFFNTVADPESINFDSQAQQGMSVTFNALPDTSIQGSVNIFAFGDSSQDLRA